MAVLFDLTDSLRKAEARLSPRASRSDRGQFRLPSAVAARLSQLLSGYEKPPLAQVMQSLDEYCQKHGESAPSRATVYHFMAKTEIHSYRVADLPSAAKEALYNLGDVARVPGHQLAFYCFNYGSLAAIEFAAALPWIDLYQAYRTRGFRPKSRGLLAAVMRARPL